MTQEDLDKIVEQHQHWIHEDVDGWEDMKADLSGADLSGADLSVANLSGEEKFRLGKVLDLDEAIKHCEEKALCGDACGLEHRQLADWLRELIKVRTKLEETKSEIEAKAKEIAKLEERIADGDKDFEMADHQNERLLKIVRHHKYKRCLDKANYWVAISYHCVDDKHRQRAEKRHCKWLKLAEQFKEVK